MHKAAAVICVAGTLMLAAASAQTGSEESSIVITFKDGRQQSFPLANIAHIEFKTAARSAPPAHGTNFMGRWQVGDGQGHTFIITLDKNGKASKTIGSPRGTWRTVNGEARISWDDGWKDTIRRAGDKYEKLAHEPGKSFEDPAGNITEAKSLEPI
jgi:hypothetical protein